jgi:hypothetical protein
VATAVGTYQIDQTVQDDDDHYVEVIDPGIDISKECLPESQTAPGTITWLITVENTGDVALDITVEDSRLGVYDLGELLPGEVWNTEATESELTPDSYTNVATATGEHQLGSVSDTATATCDVVPPEIKTFTGAGSFGGYTEPVITEGGMSTKVFELHTGPQIWWEITYYFENSESFIGDDFDGLSHYFTMWDKWGGNLMVLDSPPVAFNPETNIVTLANDESFDIDPKAESGGYRDYIGEDGIEIVISGTESVWITPHAGDQQEGTNPGKGGKKADKSRSYDMDVVWEMGEVDVDEVKMMTLYVAPGMNPGGKLQFSSPGCMYINTGPRVRAYDGPEYLDDEFLWSVSKTNQLEVCVAYPLMGPDGQVGSAFFDAMGGDDQITIDVELYAADGSYTLEVSDTYYDPILLDYDTAYHSFPLTVVAGYAQETYTIDTTYMGVHTLSMYIMDTDAQTPEYNTSVEVS